MEENVAGSNPVSHPKSQNMKLSTLTEALVSSLERIKKPSNAGEKIVISRTVSAVAFLYEKVRVAMEYREDHLIRRGAIERILKRRLFLNENGRGVAEYILKELLWAKYMPNSSIPASRIEDVQTTIDKYMTLRNEIIRGRPYGEVEKIHEWILSICACEIEEKISPNFEREAFVNYIYNFFKDRFFLKDEGETASRIQIYIAIHRVFAKSDNDLIRFEILKLTFNNLVKNTWSDMENLTGDFFQHLKTVDLQLKHKVGSKLTRFIHREIAPFLTLRDLYEANPVNFRKALEDEKNFTNFIDKICRKRYDEIGRKLARAATRSIIYIFLTKMVFALALEYPFDKYILGRVDIIPLGINTLFPPILMFLILIGISPPGQENTKKIISSLKRIVWEEKEKISPLNISLKSPIRRPYLLFIFTVFYLLTFILSFGIIFYGLSLLNYSIASEIIFIFFLSLVLFFGYRIRKTGKEDVVSDKESIFTPVADFFILPILNVGKVLSAEISKLNFLVAILDFFIEAPFKAIFEIFEEWFSFIRRKKEEII